ncbi:MAG: hypothetical protein ABWY71_01875 [Candidatus Saccharimonadales bacterium]
MTQEAMLNELIHDLEPYLADRLALLQDGSSGAALYAKLLAVMQERRIVPNNAQISTLHKLANDYNMRGLLLQIQWRTATKTDCDCD